MPDLIDTHRFSLFCVKTPLVLASASPRRREFFSGLGIHFTIQGAPDHIEPAPAHGEAPTAYTIRAATVKARYVRDHSPLRGAAVLGADTTVVLDNAMLGKPRGATEAFTFLTALAGRTHEVVTACCLCLPDGAEETFAVIAKVTMHAWPAAVLAAYAQCGEPLDKAGGYAVQGKGSFLIESIHGSWSAVIGLPMTETVNVLLRHGVLTPICGDMAHDIL